MSARSLIVLIAHAAALILTACDDREIPTAVEPTQQELPAPPAPPAPPTSSQPNVLEVGKIVMATISRTDGSCSFWDWQSGWGGLCDSFEISAAKNGRLTATVKWADGTAPLVVFSKSSTGEQIDLVCCNSPLSMSIPVDSGATYRMEIAYAGRPSGYPAISPVEYTIVAELAAITPEMVGPLSVRVFGDAAHTHHLSQARLEIVDGPSAGKIAPFNEESGLYEFESLLLGMATVRLSAPGFASLTKRLAVGTNMPPEIELRRDVPIPNAMSSLVGVTWEGKSRSSAWTGVKVEILDGPLAGIFTFSDEWFAFYQLSGLPPGGIRVRASAPWLQPQTFSVNVSGETRLDFDMERR